ncbi:uncharacterized protein B0H18DRAFT_633072 [Fomitopsis serialis]|uniref:uncharacterized protein n=1 Tax=Fomitopsis serialis TaxID=139415 RepID=UPI0020086438|nr:uncharacterized protein B0H18DRAFT_633072 [Neoantrodia serialis]KAH9919542.1 hypothetical protein B0H18DRAFT_633072 [Neoantrodia serialis]
MHDWPLQARLRRRLGHPCQRKPLDFRSIARRVEPVSCARCKCLVGWLQFRLPRTNGLYVLARHMNWRRIAWGDGHRLLREGDMGSPRPFQVAERIGRRRPRDRDCRMCVQAVIRHGVLEIRSCALPVRLTERVVGRPPLSQRHERRVLPRVLRVRTLLGPMQRRGARRQARRWDGRDSGEPVSSEDGGRRAAAHVPCGPVAIIAETGGEIVLPNCEPCVANCREVVRVCSVRIWGV